MVEGQCRPQQANRMKTLDVNWGPAEEEWRRREEGKGRGIPPELQGGERPFSIVTFRFAFSSCLLLVPVAGFRVALGFWALLFSGVCISVDCHRY